MAAPNGIPAPNGGMYGGGGNNVVLSSPGHHSDMQILMENMERLSGTLQRNRQEWDAVQQGLSMVQRMQGANGVEGTTYAEFMRGECVFYLFSCFCFFFI